MTTVRPRIHITPDSLDYGYRNCRQIIKRKLGQYTWILGNLPNDHKRALETLIWHGMKSFDLLDLQSPNHLPLDVWSDVRADVSDAFLQQYTSEEVAALTDSAQRFRIPKQFLFDMLDGSDMWIRNPGMETFEDLEIFTYRMGGAAMVAASSILGIIKPDYEIPAIRCGQAILLTQFLADCVPNLKRNRNFLALQDFEDCQVDLDQLKLGKTDEGWTHFVRLYCSRIEKLFYAGGKLLNHLDFDGKRTVTSLLAIHWKMLMNMKQDPLCILSEEGVLSNREMFRLRSRHVMGLEGNIPIIPEDDHGHH